MNLTTEQSGTGGALREPGAGAIGVGILRNGGTPSRGLQLPDGRTLSDPPAWPGWSHYRLWKKAVERWNRSTDIPVWRRSDKLLKLLDWDLQGRFEKFTSDKYLDLIFQVLDVLAGEREGAEKRSSL